MLSLIRADAGSSLTKDPRHAPHRYPAHQGRFHTRAEEAHDREGHRRDGLGRRRGVAARHLGSRSGNRKRRMGDRRQSADRDRCQTDGSRRHAEPRGFFGRLTMATATITRIDAGQTGTGSIDWLARADAIAGEIAEAAARHDADESFVSEGYQRLKEEGRSEEHTSELQSPYVIPYA